MKKILALLLALCMLFALSACGSKEVKGSVSPAEEERETNAAESAAAQEPEAAETEPEPAEAEAPEETAEEESPELGIVSGGRYENEFLGIGCELDDNWVYANEEQLASLIGITADAVGGDFGEQMLKSDLFYDMYAESGTNAATINIVIQKLDLMSSMASEEAVIDASIKTMETQLAAAGFSDLKIGKNTLSFVGEEHLGVTVSAMVQGVQLYEQQVYIKKGGYIASITFGTYVTDRTADLAELFFALG